MAGRPSLYSEDLGIEICEWIANNAAGLRVGCSQHEHWPTSECIRNWLRHNTYPEFSALYARAMEDKSETMGEDIILIADNNTIDPNDKRVRIDARKWLMGKLKPKKYGEMNRIALADEEGNVTNKLTIEIIPKQLKINDKKQENDNTENQGVSS